MVNYKGKQVRSLDYGEKLVAVVTRFSWDFRSWVKRNGQEGEIYIHVKTVKQMYGISFDRVEHGNFCTGIFGVSQEVRDVAEIRVTPKQDPAHNQKHYPNEFEKVMVVYTDGSVKEFQAEEWAIFEEGIRKIAMKLIFIKKSEND